MPGADHLFGSELPPRPRAVVDAFATARRTTTGFLLSCGLLPEVSESCTESLHREVQSLSEKHFERERLVEQLHEVLRRSGVPQETADDVENVVTTLLSADTTAAYLFGLAAGLGLGSLDRRLDDHLR